LALAGLLLAAGVMAGCSTGSNEGAVSSAGSAQDNAAAPAQPAPAEGGAAPKPAQPPDKANTPAEQQINQPGLDRKLVRTASLEMTAKDVVAAANKARSIAVSLGGFAGQEDVKSDSASITLRVPSDKLDPALEQLADQVPDATIKSRNTTAEDVTEQMVDVESRINTQRISVQRVQALLAKATALNDIVQLESEVTRREADLESLEKRRDALTGQVAMSTLTVRITKSDAPPPPPAQQADSGGFLAGLRGGWNAFLDTGGVILRVLGAVLPFVAIFGVPGYYGYRWWRRRRVSAPAAVQPETGA
jgi:hypothetical protein